MEQTQIMLPGDEVESSILEDIIGDPMIGPGLQKDGTIFIAYKAGPLKRKAANSKVLWVDNVQKRYVAVKGDHVVGIVTAKQVDQFKVDIGTSEPASLSYLSFEGATKKNRPDVKIGDLIYGQLIVASKHMESELVCMDSHGRAAGMGVIRDDGNLITLNLHWTRRLLSENSKLLKLIGDRLPYECAVGMNGWVWVKGRSIEETIAIGNLLRDAQSISDGQLESFVARTLNRLSKMR